MKEQLKTNMSVSFDMLPLIVLKNVVKNYDTPAGEVEVLKGLDLSIGAGELVAIIGKSGSGKSTLVNMLTGIDRPTTGEIMIGGTAVHTMTEDQMSLWRGHHVGVVFQFFQLLGSLTCLDNVMLPMSFCGRYAKRLRKEKGMELLDQVGMASQANKYPSEMSGGQQQRVAIARALANDPEILAADEPTGNLDTATANDIFSLFEDLTAAGKTIVMVTHDGDLAKRVHRTITIADGRIVGDTAR